ncbi:hypothetical protein RADP37_05553 [Roseomonas mucosa]|uniref:Uncharacterized protein n=1 Tax=Roseomonas mucosa TaxID=207340 RepID=A0A4Y1MZR9_9PROT|nr:hypothetical protein RADP37_05553 [Roseomonas mucosa]
MHAPAALGREERRTLRCGSWGGVYGVTRKVSSRPPKHPCHPLPPLPAAATLPRTFRRTGSNRGPHRMAGCLGTRPQALVARRSWRAAGAGRPREKARTRRGRL